MNITQLVKLVEKFTTDHSPLILTGIAAAGTITTAFLAAKASFKAAEVIQQEEWSGKANDTGVAYLMEPKDKIKLVWKLYIPTLANAALTVTCCIAANRIGTKRAAAMAAAYKISERAFEEYREKIVEKLGANKEREARDDIAQDRVRKNPVGSSEVFITGGGDVLCYDMYTGRYFSSDMNTLKKAENLLMHQLNHDGYASLNDYYSLVGLPHVQTGDDVGWNSDKIVELRITATISEDDKPCLVIDFNVTPVRDYYLTH